MLSPREAFKVGFLTRCAQLGLSAEETEQFVKAASVKLAEDPSLLSRLASGGRSLAGAAGGALATGASGLGRLGAYGLAAGIVAPPALGYGVGTALGQLTDVDDEDVDSIKQQELIDEYQRLAAGLQHRNRSYKMPRRA